MILLLIVVAEKIGIPRLALGITEKSRTGVVRAAAKKRLLRCIAASPKQTGSLIGAASAKDTALRLGAAIVSEQAGTSICRTSTSEQSGRRLRLCSICSECATKKRLLLILILVLTKDTGSLILGVVISEESAAARATKRVRVCIRVGIAPEAKSGGGVGTRVTKNAACRLVLGLIVTKQVCGVVGSKSCAR